MSITDELRKWGYGFCGDTHDVVTAIADRIDAEHEEAIQQALMGEGGVPATDENMAEHGWIRMPMDADREPIRIGDAMVLQHEAKKKPYVVQSFTWDGEDWYFTCDEGIFNVCGWEHYHAPTVENVLREMLDAWGELPYNMTNEAIVAEYAKRLQLREVDE